MSENDKQDDLWRIIEARDRSIARLVARIGELRQSMEEKEGVIRELKAVCDEREALIMRLSKQ